MHIRLSCTAAKYMVQRTAVPYVGCRNPAASAMVTGGRIGDEDMLTSIARLFNEWKRYSEARRELSHLSDRELADIGITRSDIDRIALGQADR
jgi:uncharacterized protein YjiS (DUF1127 family)